MTDGQKVSLLPQIAAPQIQAGQFTYLVNDQGDEWKVDISQLVAKMQADAGCGCVQTAKLVMTPAEIIAGGPYQFGLSVPAGYLAAVHKAYIKIDHAGADFDQPTCSLRNTTSSNSFAGFLQLDTSVDVFAQFDFAPSQAGNVFFIAGQDVEFVMASPPTVGGSTVTVYLTYMLIEI
jgi:hypothetical protein